MSTFTTKLEVQELREVSCINIALVAITINGSGKINGTSVKNLLKTAANTSNVLNAYSFMSRVSDHLQGSYLERSPSVSVAQLYYNFCWNNNIIVASMCDVIKRSIYLSISIILYAVIIQLVPRILRPLNPFCSMAG